MKIDLNEYKNKKVLVTGGTGFIGSHVVEKLIELGADITAFAQYYFTGDLGWISNLKDKIKIYYGDIRDFNAINNAMKGIDIVISAAASISVYYSYLNPRDVIETNVLGTLNVLMAARESDVEKIVQVSSSEVFGTAQYLPIDEKHPIKPQSPYAGGKAAADNICDSFFYSYDLPIIIIRPFNTFGPRQSVRAVIPWVIIQLLDGDIVQTGNLEPARDFTFVKDTAIGILLAGLSKNYGEHINFGTGKDIAIKNLIEKIASLIGKTGYRIVQKKDRKRPSSSEVMKLQADTKKIEKLFGWKPSWTLDDGLKETVKWFKENRNVYKILEYP